MDKIFYPLKWTFQLVILKYWWGRNKNFVPVLELVPKFLERERNYSSKLENPELNGNGTAIFRPFLVPFRKEIVPIIQALFWAVNHKTQEIMKEIQGFEAKNSRNLLVASKNAAEIL